MTMIKPIQKKKTFFEKALIFFISKINFFVLENLKIKK